MPLIIVNVPLVEVFGNIPADFHAFSALVRNLSRTDTLLWCARLNLILSNASNPDDFNKQNSAIRYFFSPEEVTRINLFAKRYGGTSNIRVFTRGQLLELMRWTALLAEDLPGDGKTFEDPAARRRFAQAALIAGELWDERTHRPLRNIKAPSSTSWRTVMASFRNAVAANSQGGELMRALARSVAIYQNAFRARYPTADQDFKAATGLTLEEYFACVCSFMLHYLDITPGNAMENPGIFNIKTVGLNLSPQMNSVLERYIALDSQTPEELHAALQGDSSLAEIQLTSRFDYKPLRDRPILRTQDGRAIILDPIFYSEKMTVGPLFKLVQSNRKAANHLFSAFGSAFEDYVISLLRAMYPKSPGLVDRLIPDLQGERTTGELIQVADACLNDVTAIALIEVKAAFLRDDLAQDDNSELYLQELRKKYSISEGDENDRTIKGVGQLARTITELASDQLRPLATDFNLAQVIYPVLLVYDTSLSAPGHADFLAEEFAQALKPDRTHSKGYMTKGRFTVAPLILMTIEDLENLESSIREFRLIEFFRDYITSQSSSLRSSMRDFMATTTTYRFIHSQELADRAVHVLNEAQQLLFASPNKPS